MAATWSWYQTHGNSPGTAVSLGASGNLFNFKNHDDASASNYAAYPITAGNNSYTVWLRGNWSGTFNRISNVQFWRSSNFAPSTGLSIKWKNRDAYATPATTDIATDLSGVAIPTSDPGTGNVKLISTSHNSSGYTEGSGGFIDKSGSDVDSSGFSTYIVLQLQTTSEAGAGDASGCIFTLQYDES
jgi:hypothetical protein